MKGTPSLPGMFCPHLSFTYASKSGCSNRYLSHCETSREAGARASGQEWVIQAHLLLCGPTQGGVTGGHSQWDGSSLHSKTALRVSCTLLPS